MSSFSEINMGENVTLSEQDSNCAVYSISNETGNGQMTMYEIFDGIFVMYNDFHMKTCASQFMAEVSLFCIDHCREGRIEWEANGGNFLYIEAGDMQVNTRRYHNCSFGFPLSHYHGVTVAFELDRADKILPNILDGFDVDLSVLTKKFCPNGDAFLMRADKRIEHIFSELYDLPENIRLNYCKIKVLELLLFLSSTEISAERKKRNYYTGTQVRTVKKIAEYISASPEKKYTLDELSRKFGISLTAMKSCFKGVFGTSLHAYIKSYRMNLAAVMLKNTNKSVLEIAGEVGYENAGKFSAVFKSVFGETPRAYRKKCPKGLKIE